MKTACFAGGCFWCITPVFEELDGVVGVRCGYSGGDEVNPTYEDVKHQLTGHRESLRVEYDETRICFGALVDVFLANVDPYDGGGQYIDRGRSYTLAVYYADDAERAIAGEKLRQLEESSGKPVCVALEPFRSFYDAEEYHQEYYKKNPEAFAQELRESGRVR